MADSVCRFVSLMGTLGSAVVVETDSLAMYRATPRSVYATELLRSPTYGVREKITRHDGQPGEWGNDTNT